MSTREEIIKNLDTLSEDALEGVLEYIRFIQEPEEVEPTEEEIAIIARGEREIATGDFVNWRDLKKELEKDEL
jgi:predicted transcriptional regulator